MKRIALSLFLAAAALPAAAQDPFTYETDSLLFSQADLNGDSRRDVVVVEKATGAVRCAYQQAAGGFVWSDPQPGGIEAPEALSVGRFLGPLADAFAIGSTTANRIHLAVLNNPVEVITPMEIFPAAPGPSSLAAFDIDGTGVTDLLAIGEGLAPLTNKGRARVYEAITQLNNLPLPSQAWTTNFPSLTERINPARPKNGASPRVCEVYFPAGSTTATFYLEVVGAAGVSGGINVPNLSSSTRYAAGSLDATGLTHFLFWTPGAAALKAVRIQEPSAGTFTFGTVVTHNLPKAIALVIPIQTGAGARIAVLFTDGTASVYDFDGAAAPVLRGAVPATGLDFLAPLEGGDFLTVSGLTGSPSWTRQHWNGSAYAATQNGTLIPGRPSQQVSNIVFLTAEPFVNAGVLPRKLTHFREWTSSATLTSGSAWTFQSLAYVSPVSGLGGPLNSTLSGSAAGEYPLINQYTPTLSIFGTDARTGESLGDVIFSPPPGTYAAPPVLTPLPGAPPLPATPAVTVKLAPALTGGHIFARTSPTADYSEVSASGLFPLTATTTISAFAKYPDGTRSPVRSATYTVAAATALVSPPAGPDSDGDGLPDAWELAFNTTSAAADDDGDGASNLAEFQGGTDPQNPASKPSASGTSLAFTIVQMASGPTRTLVLQWPGSETSAVLESSNNLSTWTPVTGGIVLSGGQYRYEVPVSPPGQAAKYYRLKR